MKGNLRFHDAARDRDSPETGQPYGRRAGRSFPETWMGADRPIDQEKGGPILGLKRERRAARTRHEGKKEDP